MLDRAVGVAVCLVVSVDENWRMKRYSEMMGGDMEGRSLYLCVAWQGHCFNHFKQGLHSQCLLKITNSEERIIAVCFLVLGVAGGYIHGMLSFPIPNRR